MTAMRARGCERETTRAFLLTKKFCALCCLLNRDLELADLSATHGHRQAKHVLPQLNVLEQQRAARQVVRSSFRLPRRAYGPTSISRSNQPVQQRVCDERHHGPPWRSLELNDGDNDEVAMAGRRATTMAGAPLDNLFRDRYGVIVWYHICKTQRRSSPVSTVAEQGRRKTQEWANSPSAADTQLRAWPPREVPAHPAQP